MVSPRTVIAACGLLLTILPLLTMADEDEECSFNHRVGDNCESGYICVDGKPRHKQCDPGLVFELDRGRCVSLEDISNDCRNDVALNKVIEHYCQQNPNVPVFVHPFKCNIYVNCSKENQPESLFPAYQDECDYPNYFDTRSLQCVDPANALCYSPEKPKYRCYYLRYLNCRHGCIHCETTYGDCRNKKDKLYPFRYPPEAYGRTRRFYECRNERSTGEIQTCPGSSYFDFNAQDCYE